MFAINDSCIDFGVAGRVSKAAEGSGNLESICGDHVLVSPMEKSTRYQYIKQKHVRMTVCVGALLHMRCVFSICSHYISPQHRLTSLETK